jgi:hypothetical protein
VEARHFADFAAGVTPVCKLKIFFKGGSGSNQSLPCIVVGSGYLRPGGRPFSKKKKKKQKEKKPSLGWKPSHIA